MIELSVEEKAKAYDEAIEKARKLAADLPNGRNDRLYHIWDLESIFPELKESKDERIRKSLVRLLQVGGYMSPEDKEKAFAWLEKQGEQKPTDEEMKIILQTEYEKGRADAIAEVQKFAWSEDDDIGLCDAMWAIKQAKTIAKDENDMGNLWYAEEWIKSFKDRVLLQPKSEWSEEDSKVLKELIKYHETCLTCLAIEERHKETRKWVDWLKSLRPQSQWKPSDEQIKALEHFVRSVGESGYASPYDNNTKLLYSLLSDLKKLK